jgi:dihydrofolate reductase
MRKLIYSMGVSLDGFIAAADGDIGWGAPDAELHRFHNQQTRAITAHLCGRRLYETMLSWETTDEARFGPVELEFARIWKGIPKVVFSNSLTRVEGNARLACDGLGVEVARLTEQPGEGAVSIGGAALAAQAIELGLVDEFGLFVSPVVLGGGTPFFPPVGDRLNLELLETRTFGSSVVYSRYRRT